MKAKRFMGILLTLCMVLTMVPMASITTEAADDPLSGDTVPQSGSTYSIENAAQLKNLADIVNSGKDCSGVTFNLTADIVLNNGTFTLGDDGTPLYNGAAISDTNQPDLWPIIGTDDKTHTFKGTFDGNGHTVSGVYAFSTTNNKFVGLFGSSYGTIKNTGVINSYINGNGCSGCVVGANDGTITDCYSTGIVTSTHNCGGITGFNSGTIARCYNTGSVTNSPKTIGGIVGFNDATVTECYNTGSVSGGNGSDCGGIAGYGSTSGSVLVANCYNTGTVTGGSSGETGGIVGLGNDSSTIINCYNIGAVPKSNNSGAILGMSVCSRVTNCYFLDTCESDGSNGGTAISSSDMKLSEFVDKLNANQSNKFMYDYRNNNNGYPVVINFIGSGTSDDPYQIYNSTQLEDMSYLVNNDNINFGGKCYKLMADIVLNSGTFTLASDVSPLYNGAAISSTNQPAVWSPIGTDDDIPFAGLFDGNNHTISGMFTQGNADCQGLFGCSFGMIKNTGIINSYVSGNGDSTGGIIGKNFGEVTGCYNTGAVIVTGNATGGIAGNSYVKIENCYNTGVVIGNGYYCGGIAGYGDGEVTNCYNTGIVCGENNSCGGILGTSFGVVTGCYNTGNVQGMGKVNGGIVGYNNKTVSGCYNTGSVLITKGLCGSIVGLNEGGSAVRDCFYAGLLPGIGNDPRAEGALSFVYAGNKNFNYGDKTSSAVSLISYDAMKNTFGDNFKISVQTNPTEFLETGSYKTVIANVTITQPMLTSSGWSTDKTETTAVTFNQSFGGINVDKIAQADFTFGSYDKTCTYNDSFTVLASGGSGTGAVKYSCDNTDAAVVDETSGQVTVTGTGTFKITAEKAADDNYKAATVQTEEITASPKQLTITSITSKDREYDGTEDVELEGGELSGVVNNDSVSAVIPTKGKIADKNAGENKVVTVTTPQLTGEKSSFYTLADISGITVNIALKEVTITGVTAQDKTYDGTVNATLKSGGTLNGVILGEDVTAQTGTVTFDSKNANDSASLTAEGFALQGSDAANYTLSAQPTVENAKIEKVLLAVSVEPVAIKMGDKLPTLTVNVTGFIDGESQETIQDFECPAEAAKAAVNTKDTSITSFEVEYTGGNAGDNYQFDLSNTNAQITISSDYPIGDIDEDGVVTTKDAILLQKYSARLVSLDAQQLMLADLNFDNQVNIIDIIIMQKRLAKLIVTF